MELPPLSVMPLFLEKLGKCLHMKLLATIVPIVMKTLAGMSAL